MVNNIYSMITRMASFIAINCFRLIMFFVFGIYRLNTYINMCVCTLMYACTHTCTHAYVPKHTQLNSTLWQKQC